MNNFQQLSTKCSKALVFGFFSWYRGPMSTVKMPLSKDQLKGFKKDLLIDMVIALSGQIEDLNEKLDLLTEKINVLTNNEFGRQSETRAALDDILGPLFNEAEVIVSEASPEELAEPAASDITPKERRPHPKGKRADMLKDIPRTEIIHELTGDDLICQCGGNLNPVGRELTQRLVLHPAHFELEDHYIWTYKCGSCGKMIRADSPLSIFNGSLATPSLLAGIATAKFVNAMPFDRIEKSFADCDLTITRQTMARWMIRVAEDYFSLIYDRMKEELLKNSIIHADETTVVVSRDGRKAGAKSYMWVYTDHNSKHPVVIYEYQKTRAAVHPKEFLEDFKGWLCCDGYEAYHSLGSDITVCGCWTHARRHYVNAAKALKDLPNRSGELAVSEKALKLIAEMFRLDDSWAGLPYQERLELRNTELKEKMGQYFDWVESVRDSVPPKSETGKGLTYSLNQKEYLLGLLSNPDVPLDNSEAERKIRNFVISRKNFVTIDTIAGAQASAIMFSMSETLKANGLKAHDYFKYLLEEMPKHMGDSHKDMSFLERLLPWSDKLPEDLRKTKK